MIIFSIRIFLFFILFFFQPFPFHPRFLLFFLFSFSCFSPPHKCPAPFFLFSFSPHQEHSGISLLHITERERERGLSSSSCSSISTTAGSDRLFLFFFFFIFFSYLLVLIQLYFKNWILFCVWINFFAHEQVSLFSLMRRANDVAGRFWRRNRNKRRGIGDTCVEENEMKE